MLVVLRCGGLRFGAAVRGAAAAAAAAAARQRTPVATAGTLD